MIRQISPGCINNLNLPKLFYIIFSVKIYGSWRDANFSTSFFEVTDFRLIVLISFRINEILFSVPCSTFRKFFFAPFGTLTDAPKTHCSQFQLSEFSILSILRHFSCIFQFSAMNFFLHLHFLHFYFVV